MTITPGTEIKLPNGITSRRESGLTLLRRAGSPTQAAKNLRFQAFQFLIPTDFSCLTVYLLNPGLLA